MIKRVPVELKHCFKELQISFFKKKKKTNPTRSLERLETDERQKRTKEKNHKQKSDAVEFWLNRIIKNKVALTKSAQP